VIAMIEPHAGVTCASSHHQNADDDACHGGAPAEADAIRKLMGGIELDCRRGSLQGRRVSK
jgi:hypothetical protein